jgi:F0F1-type ATP synthase assembly protein I
MPADGPWLRPVRPGPLEVDVPLSEHEQRLLEQIERALVDDDPKFASTVRTGDRRSRARRRLQLGGLLVLVGLGVLIVGAIYSVPVGVLGFLVMLGGAVLGVLNYKTATGAVEATGPAAPRGRGGKGRARRQPLKNRLEERFRRRYDQ